MPKVCEACGQEGAAARPHATFWEAFMLMAQSVHPAG